MTKFTDENPRPTLAERYGSATQSSNLRVQAERTGSADMLIAMGWSPTRLGGALIRLHSEWDGAQKPIKPNRSAIELIAKSLERVEDGMRKVDGVMVKNMVMDMAGARRTAHDWYMHELKLLFQRLKTMPEVRQQLVLWAQQQQIENADHRVAEVLAWWFDHTCPACEGRGKELIPGTPHKSHRNCKVCKGSGETPIPRQQGDDWYLSESKKLLRHIDVCIKSAQASLKQTLPRLRQAKRFAAGQNS